MKITQKSQYAVRAQVSIALLLLALLSTLKLSAQQQPQQAELTYKSGVKVKCTVIKMVPEESLTVIILSDTIEVAWDRLETVDLNAGGAVTSPRSTSGTHYVTQNAEQYYRRERVDMPYTDSSLYFRFGLTIRGGVSPFFVLNPGVSASLGYNFTPQLGAGITASSDMYWATGASFYPVGVEGIYRIADKGLALEFVGKTGYSFTRQRFIPWNVDDVSGGPFVGLGIGFNSKKREHNGWFVSFNTLYTRVKETGFSTINDGREWREISAVTIRNVTRTGFTFGIYID